MCKTPNPAKEDTCVDEAVFYPIQKIEKTSNALKRHFKSF
jgi:hypothetical protein